MISEGFFIFYPDPAAKFLLASWRMGLQSWLSRDCRVVGSRPIYYYLKALLTRWMASFENQSCFILVPKPW